jgi:peptidoglycan/xylan/chitin deacetylase (PgdA/CDA1 family)
VRSPASLTRFVGVANVVVVALALVVLFTLPSAAPPEPLPGAVPREHNRAPAEEAPPDPASALPSADLSPPVPATPESAREHKANELGLVPVLMYHRILKNPVASIDRTPAQVRAELERLATSGYVPITAREFVTGDIRIPAGAHPVVLTFDDGHASHFALDERGLPKKDTALGLIYEVAERHPGFRPVATFWINKEPFGLRTEAEQARAVQWLTARGFEVANHTWAHPNLARLPKKKVREQIVRAQRLLDRLGAGRADTLALPYGAMPHGRKVARSGKWDGTGYDFQGVFLAGAEPSVSPYAKNFDRNAVQRIQSNGKKGECRRWCSRHWLDWLDEHPDERYTADGDPSVVSVPKRLSGNISSKRRGQLNTY